MPPYFTMMWGTKGNVCVSINMVNNLACTMLATATQFLSVFKI